MEVGILLRRLPFLVMSLVLLGTHKPARAEDAWLLPRTETPRAARVGYQRDRLAVRAAGDGWYVVVDGYGRMLTAQQFARALGDSRTYDLADDIRRQQNSIGAVVTSVGPIGMVAGLFQSAEGSFRGSTQLEVAGYGTLVAGIAATAGGIALLADPRPRRPPSYYSEDQARRLVQAYNRQLLESYGLTPDEATLVPRAPLRVYARVGGGPAGLGLHGAF